MKFKIGRKLIFLLCSFSLVHKQAVVINMESFFFFLSSLDLGEYNFPLDHYVSLTDVILKIDVESLSLSTTMFWHVIVMGTEYRVSIWEKMTLACWHWRSLSRWHEIRLDSWFWWIQGQEDLRDSEKDQGSLDKGTFGNNVKQAAPQILNSPPRLPGAAAKVMIHFYLLFNWCLRFPGSWCDIIYLLMDFVSNFSPEFGTVVNIFMHVIFIFFWITSLT